MYLVDKSMYIETMEKAGHFLFLIRPRRFGKSLFLSMLRYYYDIAEKDKFQELFKGLWIAEHPTDFSQIGGSVEDLPSKFNQYFGVMLDSFMDRYAACYSERIVNAVYQKEDADGKFAIIAAAAKNARHRLYLIVDEYDNFTNAVLNEHGESVYHAMTHASGFYRDVFKKFKGNFDRILMLGVSPVTLDDLTSGYNIATSITMDARFNPDVGVQRDGSA